VRTFEAFPFCCVQHLPDALLPVSTRAPPYATPATASGLLQEIIRLPK